MLIKFHYIKFKNLLSYGNAETVLTLDQHKHTIFTAKNGSGKSGTIEAICYGLYGKPYRNIKLGQLINSINKKALLVEIAFSKGTDSFKVIRGQKPTVFEIYKNGELILEDAASRDYQAYLETEILGINFKTFKQIIVMGSAAYTPFMSLSAAERRNITEEVLDIAVFSNMSDIAKQKVAEHKSQVESLTYEIQVIKNQIDAQKELLATLTEDAKSRSDEVAQKRSESLEKIAQFNRRLDEIESDLGAIGDVSDKHDSLIDTKNKLHVKLAKVNQQIDTLNEDLSLYHDDSCPTCGQAFADDLKQTKEQEHQCKVAKLVDIQEQLDSMLEDFDSKIVSVAASVKQCRDLIQERNNILYAKRLEEQTIVSLNKETSTDGIELCKSKLKDCVASLVEKTDEKNEVSKNFNYYKTSVEILKDSGIKSKVISTFIPVLNQMINEYLNKFDMFVSFELDENFNETIKSRHRDTFTYNSFSEGEKTKIDLAILMAWRRLSMSRNSVSTNLLIFDETLDRGLDEDSVQIFIDILGAIEDTVNSIVISHRNIVPELFDRHMTVEKVRDFSILST